MVVADAPISANACFPALSEPSGSAALGPNIINLNQPAGCFFLKSQVETAGNHINLAVRPLAAPRFTLAVKIGSQTISPNPDVAPAPFSASLPVAVAGIFIIALLTEDRGKKIFVKLLPPESLNINFKPNFNQSRILRC